MVRSTKQNIAIEVGGAAPKIPLSMSMESFARKIQQEYTVESAIDPVLFCEAVSFAYDQETDRDGISSQPIAEALGWKVQTTQLGFSAQQTFYAALLDNEDGTTWQAVLSRSVGKSKGFGAVHDSGKFPKRAPKGNGSRAFLPVIPPEIRRKIGERYEVEVPEFGSFWDWVADHPEIPITGQFKSEVHQCLID